MVPRLNYVLMVVLSVGLLAVVTGLALSSQPKEKPAATDLELSAWINRLGNSDMDLVRQARSDLISAGQAALPRLKLALDSDNAQVRDQARRVIDVIEGRRTDLDIEP
jgi:hypothetical protein